MWGRGGEEVVLAGTLYLLPALKYCLLLPCAAGVSQGHVQGEATGVMVLFALCAPFYLSIYMTYSLPFSQEVKADDTE